MGGENAGRFMGEGVCLNGDMWSVGSKRRPMVQGGGQMFPLPFCYASAEFSEYIKEIMEDVIGK